MRLILLSIFLLGLGCTHMENSDPQETQSQDKMAAKERNKPGKRSFREIKLGNGMRVLLISDPNLNKSAAAMDVGVGSLSDPREHPGLAHFLEHMLFLGTKKYPEVGAYGKYLEKHQGYSNAYTSSEHTNYFFEVNHDAFKGALDRFAQFFIAPSFAPEFVEREINAVDSEHEKNLQIDGWRIHQTLRSLHKSGHPLQKFATGDSHTLSHVTRDILIAFYKKHYSASVMNLTIMSPQPEAELAEYAEEMFSAVPSPEPELQKFDPEIFSTEDLPRLVQIVPVKDLKHLNFVFAIPSQDSRWRDKPAHIVAHLIGHEGPGSLLSYLKREGLATELSAGDRNYKFAGTFHVNITLTQQGFSQWRKVSAAFFSYVEMLRQSKIGPYIFSEVKRMADLDHQYKDHEEGGDIASHFAARMKIHPGEEIEFRDQLFHEENTNAYKQLLDYLQVEHANIVLVGKEAKTDKTEAVYGTKYSSRKLTAEEKNEFSVVTVDKALHLPPPNPYIPTSLALYSSKIPTSPAKVLDDDFGEFWFQRDDTFFLPKAAVRFDILTNVAADTPLNWVLSDLYLRAINEDLNEWKHTVLLAGLNFSIRRNDYRGITISVDGYSEKLPLLVEDLSKKLKSIDINKKTFGIIKDDIKRNIDNFAKTEAYKQSLYELEFLTDRKAIHYKSFYDTQRGIDLVSPITLAELRNYVNNELFAKFAVTGAAYGNMEAKSVKTMVSSFVAAIGKRALKAADRPKESIIALPSDSSLYVVRTNPTNNSAWTQNVQLGPQNPRLNAILRIGLAYLSQDFYSDLRSHQQLGYIVVARMLSNPQVLGMRFLIQSSTYTPTDIASRVSTWREKAAQHFKKITSLEFEAYRGAVINELAEKAKTIRERLDTLYMEAIKLRGQFDYRKKIAKEAKQLSRQQVLDTIVDVLNKDRSSLAVFLSGSQVTPRLPDHGQQINDLKRFKESADTF